MTQYSVSRAMTRASGEDASDNTISEIASVAVMPVQPEQDSHEMTTIAANRDTISDSRKETIAQAWKDRMGQAELDSQDRAVMIKRPRQDNQDRKASTG